MNTLGRRSQPPSMVSLPPVRLPPLSTSTSRQTVAGQRSTSPLNATMHPSAHAPPPTHQQQEQHQQQHDVPPPSSSSSSSSSHPVGASASVSFGSPLHMPPESQQTRPRTPTAVSWHRMRLANTRASSGTNRSTPPGTPTRRDSDLPWPGRAP
ncbi:hypothetical protein PTSG_01363 [Salpingoeca rosetta]|uniref:Uncharacterized protein n=1 Tax=Salpingoeca rosetta (strain ATCC 50818 / BSB-021) TaxID=946362 RepID=F2U046_SALR5|nr:uncharacterized protein PTSG_01363 [Salpingoeca rosetta]EGD80774.1 hypothetical protein PTSG_01363 [Salpingoeca rosetta]|eukprot:XP_004997335.1 hypothetical protein PTSG_01363 [Salpingoeca rosetta]